MTEPDVEMFWGFFAFFGGPALLSLAVMGLIDALIWMS